MPGWIEHTDFAFFACAYDPETASENLVCDLPSTRLVTAGPSSWRDPVQFHFAELCQGLFHRFVCHLTPPKVGTVYEPWCLTVCVR